MRNFWIGSMVVGACAGFAYGGAHTWDVSEVFSNADGSIQFVELVEGNGTPGEVGVGNKVVSSLSLGTAFTIAQNVAEPTSNRHLLFATQAFAKLPGAPVPDQIIPSNMIPFFDVNGDSVSYGAFDTFTFGPVPLDGINSMNDGGFIALNSPTNYAGDTGVVDAGMFGGPIPPGSVRVELETVATGLTSPVHLTHAGDGSGRLFVVDQAGLIRIIKNDVLLPTPFLDLTRQIPALNPGFDERGVLGMAFHPNFETNGRFFVRYSRPRKGVPAEPCFVTSRGCHEEVLAEFAVSKDPDIADPTPAILFAVDEPEFNHNAGAVAFGPDGYLYFSLGDGGGANDGLDDDPPTHGPIGNGQNIETALGALLRIDVDAAFPYGIPEDNPFVGKTGLDEIYAYGFRNPFRFSFDDGPGGDGTLYLGDVGQDLFEELNIVEHGGNYGWAVREGAHCFDPFEPGMPGASCDSSGLIDPIVEYLQDDGGVSILAGYVYRGSASPCLVGTYVFGDFSRDFGLTGSLYYLVEPIENEFEIHEMRIGPDGTGLGRYLKGLGEDEEGEIYALVSSDLAPTGNSGEVLRIKQIVDGDENGDCSVAPEEHAALVDCLEGPASDPTAGGTAVVDVAVGPGFDFIPSDVVVAMGDTVRWTWEGGIHNVESGIGAVHDGNFRSGEPTSVVGTTYEVTFDGSFLQANPVPDDLYPYYCVLHESFGMTGMVEVAIDPCHAYDTDGDGDVDLRDWSRVQLSFTGLR